MDSSVHDDGPADQGSVARGRTPGEEAGGTVAWQPATAPSPPRGGAGVGPGGQTVEEARVDQHVPCEILSRGGMSKADGWKDDLDNALREVTSLPEAERAMIVLGRRLWQRAVDRAHGRAATGSGLQGTDDRPLYWMRLTITRALRAWCARSPFDAAGRLRILLAFEHASRGIGRAPVHTPAPATAQRTLRVVVTGFDPFLLDRSLFGTSGDLRHSNPSGSLALALDGTVLDTDAGPAHVTTMVFPLRWHAFAHGIVERALAPYFQPGPHRVDLFTTVSQGRADRFDLEHFNGAWRGVVWDNLNRRAPGPVPVPADVPTVRPQPQWTTTTLPTAHLTSRATGPFPVYDHTTVTEIPADSLRPVERENGPTPRSLACEGGGGDYLSNEIGYRATLLRDACRLRVPGGHLHTPILSFGPDNRDQATGRVTDPALERARGAILAQARSLLTAALNTLSPPH